MNHRGTEKEGSKIFGAKRQVSFFSLFLLCASVSLWLKGFLTLARLGDEFKQGLQVDGAGDDLIADNEARRALDAELFGESIIVGEDAFDVR